jgi:hypothetical protein
MARYNKYNHGIKYNQKLKNEGGQYNVRLYGVIGQVTIRFTVSVVAHVKRRAKSVINISSSVTAIVKRTFRSAVNVAMSSFATADAIRKRHAHTVSDIQSSVRAAAKRKRRASSLVDIVFSLWGKLVQKYKPLFPRLSYTEYPVKLDYTEYRAKLDCTEYVVDLSLVTYAVAMTFIEYLVEMEMIGLPYCGSTITLKGTFPDSAGDLEQLDDVVCKVYGPGNNLLETLTAVEVSTGIYTADYTIPEGMTGQFDYEFSGTLGNKTIVGRSSFESVWR